MQCPSCFEVKWRLALETLNMVTVSPYIRHTVIDPASVKQYCFPHSLLNTSILH
jgi:hypothetical protein